MKDTKDVAVEFVLDYEKKQGRIARDVQSDQKCKGYDVLSHSNEGKIARTIEVKGTRSGNIPDFYATEIENGKLVASHLYVVSVKENSDEIDRFFIIERSEIRPEDFSKEKPRYRIKFRKLDSGNIDKYEMKRSNFI
ncbi:MAG: DUF3883 domain-containing protein [Candidatus Altiarchaeia archaeon]